MFGFGKKKGEEELNNVRKALEENREYPRFYLTRKKIFLNIFHHELLFLLKNN